MVDLSDYTVINYLSDHGGHKCGYCGGSDCNYSRGMWAYRLTCDDYEDLINRGCRRSGQYIYKPTMDISCCPCYTIKCDPLNFRLTKSHKKVIKCMTRFLKTGEKRNYTAPTAEEEEDEEELYAQGWRPIRIPIRKDQEVSEAQRREAVLSGATKAPGEVLAEKRRAEEKAALGEAGAKEGQAPGEGETDASPTKSQPSKKQARMPRPGKGIDPTKPPCKKAKQLRRERKLAKLAKKAASDNPDSSKADASGNPGSSKAGDVKDSLTDGSKEAEMSEGSSVDPPKPPPQTGKKMLRDYLKEHDDPGPDDKHKLEISLVRSAPKRWPFNESFKESYALYKKYQTIIHEDPPERCTEKQLSLVRASPKRPEYLRTQNETFAVFKKYQLAIHKESDDEWEMQDFNRFLVESPLTEIYPGGAPKHGFGTFHQHYRIDGKLVAVAVLDILPKSISSVYFFYDPDYGFLSLGNYSALREIAYAQEVHDTWKKMEHYYMGFYIHDCPKMKYKRHFPPSYLLCPIAYTWVPFEICKPKLDEKPYCRLDETDKEDEPPNHKKVLLFYQRMIMPYDVYQLASQMGEYYTEEIKEYANTFGKKCSEKLLLVLS